MNNRGIVVSLRFSREYMNVQLVVSRSPDLSDPIYSRTEHTNFKVAKISVEGLLPYTEYYYGVLLNGILHKDIGRFRTSPTPNHPASFTFHLSSCGNNDHAVFDQIISENPDFFLYMGDFHYANITENNVDLYRQAFDTVFSGPRRKSMHANMPVMYIWDDHDFGNNDSDLTSPSVEAAQRAYRERVPHPPLATGDKGLGSIHSSFVYGRVRFIQTDLRTHKSWRRDPDTKDKTMMGEDQLQWFFKELLKPEPIKAWVCSMPWIGSETWEGCDWWAGYKYERTRIANFIKENNLTGKVIILSGDMHSIAIDDGTNSDFATGGGAPIKVFHAAALTSASSTKGGPWSHGPFFPTESSGGQFGVMKVTDNNTGNINIEWIGRRMDSELVRYSFDVPVDLVPDVDNSPPEPVTNLSIDKIMDKSANLSWKVSVSPSISRYEVSYSTDGISYTPYSIDTKGNSCIVEGLSPDTAYHFKIVAVNHQGLRSTEVVVSGATSPLIIYCLEMDGITDRIALPKLTHDRIVIDMEVYERPNQRYLGSSTSSVRVATDSYGMDESRGYTTATVNGEPLINGTKAIKFGERVVLEVNNSQPFMYNVFAFGSNKSDATDLVKGRIHSLKVYHGEFLQAHYDFSQGSLKDISGNGIIPEVMGGSLQVYEGLYTPEPIEVPGKVMNLTVQETTGHSITVSWDTPVGSTAVKHLISIIDSVGAKTIVSDNVVDSPYTILGLSELTEYTVEVVPMNANGDKGAPTTVVASTGTTPLHYLQMDGISDTIRLPVMNHDKVELVFEVDEKRPDQSYIGSSNSSTSFRTDTNGKEIFPGYSKVVYDGEEVVSGTSVVIPGRIVTAIASNLEAPFNDLSVAFGTGSSVPYRVTKGKIYKFKVYLKDVLLASYDFTTGETADISGNNVVPSVMSGVITLDNRSTKAPQGVTSLSVTQFDETSAHLSWTGSITPETTGYTVYYSEDGISFSKLGTTQSTSYEAVGLVGERNVYFRVCAFNHLGTESIHQEIQVNLPEAKKFYLLMDGVSDILKTRSVTHDRIVMDADVEVKAGVRQRLIGSSTSSVTFRINDVGTDHIGGYTDAVYKGVPVVHGSPTVIGGRGILEVSNKTSEYSSEIRIFGKDDVPPIDCVKGKIYDIKIFRGELLVGHFDLTTGTYVDISGNNLELSITGGTFIESP